MDPTQRGKEATVLEQAVSRAVRDNLALIQHTAQELSHAIEDLVAACGSNRNANMLPSMLRAQTAAASLASMLDVISRLLTSSLQPSRQGASEILLAGAASAAAVEAPAAEPPRAVTTPPRPAPVAEPRWAPPPPATVWEAPPAPPPVEVITPPAPVIEPEPPVAPPPEPVVEAPVAMEPAPAAAPEPEPIPVPEPVAAPEPEPEPVAVAAAPGPEETQLLPVEPEVPAVFRVEDLPAEQQELHRRANRHAKVSMQDISLLRPKDVQLARQNKDICVRLRNDLDKARKEYVRRFGPILEHPVDYFKRWMVEVLAEGKPEALGEYPYPSPVTHH
jgi:hypothetical protein